MWTRFMDMNSGGGQKEKAAYIYIEAPEDEAKIIFYNRFGHNPERVSCTGCGEDYYISENVSLQQATGYERGCLTLELPKDINGRYVKVDDPWFREHYYLEDGEEEEASKRGYTVDKRRWGLSLGKRCIPLVEYIQQNDVIVISAVDIKPGERVGTVPE